MTVQFQINGQTRIGKVIARGYGKVDSPESFEVEVNKYGFTKWIPVKDCKVI